MSTSNTTKVLSVRVPEQFAKELQKHCKHNNTSVSKILQNGFTDTQSPTLFKPETIKIDEDLGKMLISVGGGSLAGILAYKGVKYIFRNDEYTEQQKEMFSIGAGVMVALLATGLLNALLKD